MGSFPSSPFLMLLPNHATHSSSFRLPDLLPSHHDGRAAPLPAHPGEPGRNGLAHSTNIPRAHRESSPAPHWALPSATASLSPCHPSSCSGMSSRSSGEKWRKASPEDEPSSNGTCLCLISTESLRLEGVLFVFSIRPNTMQKGLLLPQTE